MNVIVREFSRHINLPIDIADVAEAILERGFADSIEFYDIEVDRAVVDGLLLLRRFKPPYRPDEVRIAQIGVVIGMDASLRRLVCCKELLHILDADGEVAAERAVVSQLISHVVLPTEIANDLQKLGLPVLNDHLGVLSALAVLLPRDALDELRPMHAQSRISITEIADLAELPESVVTFALTPEWQTTLQMICGDC